MFIEDRVRVPMNAPDAMHTVTDSIRLGYDHELETQMEKPDQLRLSTGNM